MKILVIEAIDEIIKSNLKERHNSDLDLWAMDAIIKEEWLVEDDFEITLETTEAFEEEFIKKHRFCIRETIKKYFK